MARAMLVALVLLAALAALSGPGSARIGERGIINGDVVDPASFDGLAPDVNGYFGSSEVWSDLDLIVGSSTVILESTTTTATVPPASIRSNKGSLVRGTNFVATIQGESSKTYWVYVADAGVGAPAYPMIKASQSGVDGSAAAIAEIAMTDFAGHPGTGAKVTTTASGVRPIEFSTTADTKPASFWIKVADPTDTSNNNEVMVVVEKGKVTITASGAGTYYLGAEIKLTGTNTDNKTAVHLFITGPNLPKSGALLTDFSKPVESSGTTKVAVQNDNTWELLWDTSALPYGPDAGTYTIWAVSQPVDANGAPITKETVGDAVYASTSIVLKAPFVIARSSSSTIARGDELTLEGEAEHDINYVCIWIFGEDYQLLAEPVDVRNGYTFAYTLERTKTAALVPGEYRVIVQNPNLNGRQDVFKVTGSVIGNTWSSENVDLAGRGSSDASTVLKNWLEAAGSDDLYTTLAFHVEDPWIGIDSISDKHVGDTFTITGTTNIAEMNTIQFHLRSASTGTSVNAQLLQVAPGMTSNTWSSWEIDSSTLAPGQYIVVVDWVGSDSAAFDATFDILDGATNPGPTSTFAETTVVTTAVTTPIPSGSDTGSGDGGSGGDENSIVDQPADHSLEDSVPVGPDTTPVTYSVLQEATSAPPVAPAAAVPEKTTGAPLPMGTPLFSPAGILIVITAVLAAYIARTGCLRRSGR